VDKTRDQEVEDLFAGALEQPEADRALWLERACGDDRELRAEVESLLHAYRSAVHVLDPGMLPGQAFAPPSADENLAEGRTLGPWRLVRLLGTGGMGAVYLGERIDDAFRMQVAIKILSAGSFHPGLLSRFRNERQILADLDHPGIARLLDGGTTAGGTPWFVMEYVDGAPIHEAARERGLSLEERLELFLEVAAAVQYAHANLVVHRDLKPGNILLRRDGRPKLLDFGIARVFGAAATSDGGDGGARTTWALTPRYASPEQVRGERLTTATDIYSLGVVLYELLTGRHPYGTAGRSLVEIGRAMEDGAPIPPSRLRDLPDARRFAGDLDTILLKALAREPGRRYAGVVDFAEDIRRHLAGEPVLARGDSAGYRLGRFARRHRGVVASIVAAFLTLVIALAVTLWAFHQARNSARVTRWYAYSSTLAAAEAAIMNHSIKEARELLGTVGPEFRGWEYRHLMARLDRSESRWQGHAMGITRLAFSPDGTRLLSTSVDRTARLWRVATHDSLAAWPTGVEAESGDFFPDPDRVALGLTDGRVALAEAGSPELQILGKGRSYALIDVHPEGRLVAAGFDDGSVALLDASDRREVRRWPAHPRLALPLFSPDGRQVVTAGSDSLIRIWNIGSGELVRTLAGHRRRVFALAFSRDGRRLASGSRDRTAIVWNMDTGLAAASFAEHRGTVGALVFHTDGHSILSEGSEGRVMVWDAITGSRIAEYHGHEADVTALDIAPDGRRSATGEWNGVIRLWAWGVDDVRVLAPSRHELLYPLRAMDIDPSGRRVTSVGHDDDISVREIDGSRFQYAIEMSATTAVLFPEPSRTLVGRATGSLQWLGPDGDAEPPVETGVGITALARSPDGRTFGSAHQDGSIHLWALPSLEPVRSWPAHGASIADLAFSGDGSLLATAGTDGTLRTWNAANGDSVATLGTGDDTIARLAFHPREPVVVATTDGGAAIRWNATGDDPPDTLLAAGNGAFAVTVSPDGSRIAIGSLDQMVHLLDWERGAPILRLHGHISRVSVVRFTPDGRSLVSASHDGTMRVWATD
jgi:WD40 repeat protein